MMDLLGSKLPQIQAQFVSVICSRNLEMEAYCTSSFQVVIAVGVITTTTATENFDLSISCLEKPWDSA
jgi:hypothetical protein